MYMYVFYMICVWTFIMCPNFSNKVCMCLYVCMCYVCKFVCMSVYISVYVVFYIYLCAYKYVHHICDKINIITTIFFFQFYEEKNESLILEEVQKEMNKLFQSKNRKENQLFRFSNLTFFFFFSFFIFVLFFIVF